MRRQTTLFLFLLVAGVALGALSAWALAPVRAFEGGGATEGNDAVVVDDDAATTASTTPDDVVELSSLPLGENPLRVSEIDVFFVVDEDAETTPAFPWEDVELSLPREDPLDKKKKRHETCPVADLAAQCPPHKADVHYQNYTMRTYYGGDWATTRVNSSRLELAAAKGYGTLSRYFNGNNDENERMPSTSPLVTGFVLNDTTTGSVYLVSAWIPADFQNDAPRPFDDQGVEVRFYGRETYFVANWTGGPATAGGVVAKANELADSLDRNKEKYKKKTAWFMSYSPMSQLTGRYYEVAFQKKDKKD